jgi:hypothetical protein
MCSRALPATENGEIALVPFDQDDPISAIRAASAIRAERFDGHVTTGAAEYAGATYYSVVIRATGCVPAFGDDHSRGQ